MEGGGGENPSIADAVATFLAVTGGGDAAAAHDALAAAGGDVHLAISVFLARQEDGFGGRSAATPPGPSLSAAAGDDPANRGLTVEAAIDDFLAQTNTRDVAVARAALANAQGARHAPPFPRPLFRRLAALCAPSTARA